MKAPRLTVLMCVHNGGPWLRSAVKSVLGQSWRDFEFLIIDDASTDDSIAQIAANPDPRIRLVRLPENLGLTRSLNFGLQEARGEFVARQDSDDLSARERFSRQIAFLEAHPEVAVLGTQGALIDAAGRSRGPRRLPVEAASVRWLSLFDNPVIHSAAMFRSAVVREEFRGYDESFPTCQDYDLWTRIMQRHEVRNLPLQLVSVREHDRSISAMRRQEGEEMVRRVVRSIVNRDGIDLSERDLDLVVAFRRHLRAEEVDGFRSVVTRWDERFRPPTADLARNRARILARVGYNLLCTNRLSAVTRLAESLRTDPGLISELPWMRMFALFLLGDAARRLAGR